jgi:hypothetical protein
MVFCRICCGSRFPFAWPVIAKTWYLRYAAIICAEMALKNFFKKSLLIS